MQTEFEDVLGLSEEERMVAETLRRFAEDEVLPGEIERDAAGEFPAQLVSSLAEQGMLGVLVPEDYDGAGMGMLAVALVIEELAKVSGSLALCVSAHTTLGTMAVVDLGTEEQKKVFVPGMAAGELVAFALTEEGAGSDVSRIATTARRDGEDWVLDGAKAWVTNAGSAEHFVIVARASEAPGLDGLGVFLVAAGTEGLQLSPRRQTCGVRSSTVHDLQLSGCRVGNDRLLGGEVGGFAPLRRTMDRARIAVAALSLGLAEGALDRAARYATERVAFGKAIGRHQAMAFLLADMSTQIEAARHLMVHAARVHDAGGAFSAAAMRAKLFASEMAVKVSSNAIQIHGGYGYTSEYHVERMYRDSKLFTIGEGTSEILRVLLAREVLAEHEGEG